MIWAVPFDVALLTVGLYALLRGDRPEKLGALINLCATTGSTALRLSGLAKWSASGSTLGLDIIVSALFFWLGCRTTRYWPIWSFGFALAIVAADVAKIELPQIGVFAFASGQFAYVYLALLSLALGTFRAARSPRDPQHGYRPPCPTQSSPMHGNS